MSHASRQQDFMTRGAAEAADFLRAVSNRHRLLVLCLLIDHDELSVGEIQAHLDLSQSALSQHLARLRRDHLVCCRRDAQTMYYRLADPGVEAFVDSLKQMFCPT